ncbi:MAG: beta-lactamase family protein [Streptococcaceae bacterium]|jgi:CubicO group peptidase (beta-lactamase class C family)|nr:beta-lactamase family protein [Streptococcaceae bacterium]
MKKTNACIQQQMDSGIYPGANWSFFTPYTRKDFLRGFAQIYPSKEGLRENMLFDLASLTKVIATTTIVLQAWERGEIDIDAPFRRYYPSFQDGVVTIRHLLTHTSQINPWIENRDELSASELRKAFNSLQHEEEIGKKVLYTDTGTVLLGFMIEELYQKDLISVFQEEILNPLGMNSTFFWKVPASNAVPTELHSKRGLIRGETHDPKAFTLGIHAGSAGMFSTLNDVCTFVQKVYFDYELLKKETIFSLIKDFTPDKKGGRSLGWDLIEGKDAAPFLFHTGFTGTFIFIDVVHQFAFVFLSNRVHPKNDRAEYLESRDQLLKVFQEELEAGAFFE